MFTFKRVFLTSLVVVILLGMVTKRPAYNPVGEFEEKQHLKHQKVITEYFKKDFEDILVVLKFMDSSSFSIYSDTIKNDVSYIFDGVLEKRDTYLMMEDYKKEQLGAIKAMNGLLSDVYTLANINRHLLESGETSQEYFKNENRIESYQKALKGVNEYVSIKNPLIK